MASSHEGHPAHPVLTPVAGGHVWAGTWEGLAGFSHATCAACGEHIKIDGALVAAASDLDNGGLCTGWPAHEPRGQLVRVARGITREAPDDKPNGPLEESLVAMYDAHVAAIGPHDNVRMTVDVPKMLAVGERAHALGEAIADLSRALRLALEHDERA